MMLARHTATRNPGGSWEIRVLRGKVIHAERHEAGTSREDCAPYEVAHAHVMNPESKFKRLTLQHGKE
jgi:hypothetical protein